MKKIRIDQLLVEKGLVNSRQRAQALILAGKVVADDHRIDKPGTKVNADCQIRLKGEDHPYVSRGGLKLKGALDAFKIDVSGFTCLDIGASTGGFTHCLLLEGAEKIFAVDVGTNQLDWSLKNHPQVDSREQLDFRNLKREELSVKIDLIVIDASFISLKKLLPHTCSFLESGGILLPMVKPQFEAGREHIGKKGVVKSEQVQNEIVSDIVSFSEKLGFNFKGQTKSPIQGPQGNQEYFLWLTRN